MPLPNTHKDAILAMLTLAEDLAYLVLDRDFNIDFSSPKALDYGIAPGNLTQGPEWLAALRPRLAQLFLRPSLFSHTTLDVAHHPISIQAQVIPLDGVPRLLILLRHAGEAARLNLAPYHAATGLYSATFIEHKIDEELERLKRFPSVFSLLAISVTPLPQPITPLGDLLRIHFRAIDIVGHAHDDSFLVLLPGTTRDQARLAGARLRVLAEDLNFTLPAPLAVRYTATEASASDTRLTLFARLNQHQPTPA